MIGILAFFAILPAAAQQISYSVEKIWNTGNHCAFTSLVHFKGRYYCSFREGASHIFDKDGKAEGKVRVIASEDGVKWESVAYVGKEGVDLRDPKLSVTPEGKLLVTIGGSIYRNRNLEACIPHYMLSDDGKTFTAPEPAEIDPKMTTKRDWVWRVTWHGGVGYAVSYNKAPEGDNNGNELWLLKTTDGKKFGWRLFHYIAGGGMMAFGRTVKQDEVALRQSRFLAICAVLAAVWTVFWIF